MIKVVSETKMKVMRCFNKFNNDRICDMCYVNSPELHKECRR